LPDRSHLLLAELLVDRESQILGSRARSKNFFHAMIAIFEQIWSEQLLFLFMQLAPNRQTNPAFRETLARNWQSTPYSGKVLETYPTDCENNFRLADYVEHRAYAAPMAFET
jgi:hypothetical protein